MCQNIGQWYLNISLKYKISNNEFWLSWKGQIDVFKYMFTWIVIQDDALWFSQIKADWKITGGWLNSIVLPFNNLSRSFSKHLIEYMANIFSLHSSNLLYILFQTLLIIADKYILMSVNSIFGIH